MRIKLITSRDNALFKELRQLAGSAQACRHAGRTLLDGVHLCEAYVRQVGMPRLCVVGETASKHHEVHAIQMLCETGGAACIQLPDILFNAISQVEQGIQLMFVIDVPGAKSENSATQMLPLQQPAVLLDNVQDPGNLGSILRSAAAAGVRAMFCSAGCASAWAPKVMRAGMGAHFSLTIAEDVDLASLMTNSMIPTVATSSHADNTVYALDLRSPVAWLFGHEGQGVKPELLQLATHQILIPQVDAVESLNVAASAAVCLFEQVRQKTL
ncbi:MAG: RNA methyltransferase [Pseudomonadota bacterium]